MIQIFTNCERQLNADKGTKTLKCQNAHFGKYSRKQSCKPVLILVWIFLQYSLVTVKKGILSQSTAVFLLLISRKCG